MKFLLQKMVLPLALMVILPMGAFAQIDAKVSLDIKDEPVSSALAALGEQIPYNFFFNDDLLEDLPNVSLKYENAPLEDVLNALLGANGLSYVVDGTNILIIRKPEAQGRKQSSTPPYSENSVKRTSSEDAQPTAQKLQDDNSQNTPFNVRGTIYGSEGNPVPGVVVLVQGTSKAVTSDIDGNYLLEGLSKGEVLVYSMLGFKDATEKMDGRGVVNVIMESEVTSLDEVVVVAYGTQKKSDLTGAVGLVKMEDVNFDTPAGVDAALQGRVAGMEIVGQSGDPEQSASIRIRGTRSISAGNDPLIVVDGVIDLVDNLSNINPDDIKSISVLKDASSTALYGSRGANGVILVTTKGGSDNTKLKINFANKVIVSQIAGKLDLMDASEFATFRNDLRYMQAYQNNGNTTEGLVFNPPYENPEALGKGTDWMKELTRIGVTNTHYLSLSSGSSKQHAFASFYYNDTRGVVKASGAHKFDFLFKYDRKVAKWLQLGTRVQFNFKKWDKNLSKGAGKMLLFVIVVSYISTVCASLFTFGATNLLYPLYLSQGELSPSAETITFAPYIDIKIPPLCDILSALLLSFIVGLGIIVTGSSALKKGFEEFGSIIKITIEKVIIPLLPIYIFTMMCEMSARGVLKTVLGGGAKIILTGVVLSIIYLIVQYVVVCIIAKKNPFRCLANMLPAYLTGFSICSSSAVIPVTLQCSLKNGVSKEVAGFTIPLCGTVHMCGSTIKLAATTVAVMFICGQPVSFAVFLPFALMQAIAAVAAPGVMSGVLMASVGLLETMIGVNPEQCALIMTLYLALDGYGPACNVTGDGAIAILTDKVFGNKN